MRKHQAIDLLKLYSSCNAQQWNEFLTRCQRTHDIPTLAKTRYELQAGMVDLSKKKMNTDKMIEWFIRLQNSIENTIKLILREKNPHPCDDPLKAAQYLEFKGSKTERDQDFERFLRRSSY